MALISHTVRRAVYWDKVAGCVATEAEDAVLATFLSLVGAAGLHCELICERAAALPRSDSTSSSSSSSGDGGPVVEPLRLYAVAASRAALLQLQLAT